MTLGLFDNFPPNPQFAQVFTSAVSAGQLQQKLIEVFCEANKREFSFEEAANPTIPGCRVIFEFGLADSECFNFIDDEEVEKALKQLAEAELNMVDFFCAIRYYRREGGEKRALKFDYYLLRTLFGRSVFEIQVYHKKGLRYVSPEDLTLFVADRVNEASKRKILKVKAEDAT